MKNLLILKKVKEIPLDFLANLIGTFIRPSDHPFMLGAMSASLLALMPFSWGTIAIATGVITLTASAREKMAQVASRAFYPPMELTKRIKAVKSSTQIERLEKISETVKYFLKEKLKEFNLRHARTSSIFKAFDVGLKSGDSWLSYLKSFLSYNAWRHPQYYMIGVESTFRLNQIERILDSIKQESDKKAKEVDSVVDHYAKKYSPLIEKMKRKDILSDERSSKRVNPARKAKKTNIKV